MSNIEEQVRRHRLEQRLPKNIAGQIRAKYERHLSSYDQHLNPLALGLISNPGLYDQVNELPALQAFFRSHIEIALELDACEGVISCGDNWLKVARFPNRLLIENPLTEKIESWARPSSASRNYPVHYKGLGRSDKSRFLGNYSYIKALELAVFNHGIGMLRGSNALRMYAQFESEIGTCPMGRPLTFVRLEITREYRAPMTLPNGGVRKTGRYLAIHGYPVDVGDVEQDLATTPIRRADIPLI